METTDPAVIADNVLRRLEGKRRYITIGNPSNKGWACYIHDPRQTTAHNRCVRLTPRGVYRSYHEAFQEACIFAKQYDAKINDIPTVTEVRDRRKVEGT